MMFSKAEWSEIIVAVDAKIASQSGVSTEFFLPLRSSRLDLSLLIEGQLLSQEQDLRAQGCARAEQEAEKKKSVRDQIGDQVKQRIQ
jgi:hypothetical protein